MADSGYKRFSVDMATRQHTSAALSWGVGLVAIGVTVAVSSALFMANYRGLANDYCESIIEARRSVPLLSRYVRPGQTGALRISIGIGFLFFAMVILSIGIIGLAAL